MEPCAEAKARGKPCAVVEAAASSGCGWRYEVVCPRARRQASGVRTSRGAAEREAFFRLACYKCQMVTAHMPAIPPFVL